MNGQEKNDIQVEETNLSDGSKLKVYNSASEGDKVELKITWQIQNMSSLFRQSELKSVILWNRILVYATLYGQAKKVSDVLKRYNIHLSNPSLDEFTHSATPLIILNNVSRLESYVSASDTVSNFSINSNSGSGGLGGGTF